MRQLENLSNRELSVSLEVLVKHERVTSADILLHLIEVEKREIHVHEGYGSLFSYCTGKLRYSEPAANRRISSARAMARVPEVYELLVSGELSLTTLSLISGELSQETKENLLAQVRGKSRNEVQAILAEKRPQVRTQERVRPVVVASPRVEKKEAEPLVTHRSSEPFSLPLFGEESPARKEAPVEPELPPEKRYALSFSVNEETYRKVEQAKVLLAGRCSKGASLEELFSVVLGEYVERHAPEERQKRREERRAKAKEGSKLRAVKSSDPTKQVSRHIPAETRDQVFIRDGASCSYVGPDGIRCGSTHRLQIDHRVPFAKGGRHQGSNLRVVCALCRIRHKAHYADSRIMPC